MQISTDYKRLCEKMILANLRNKNYVVGPNYFQNRVKSILDFLKELKFEGAKILDIGSGAYMPIVLGATHACDVVEMAGDILKTSGWKGSFEIGSCDNLPYKDKEFDIADCSEVIEHLPELDSVAETFKEIERVAKKWVMTTPKASKSGFRDDWNIEPTHLQFFTLEDIKAMVKATIPDADCIFEEVGHYVFILRV